MQVGCRFEARKSGNINVHKYHIKAARLLQESTALRKAPAFACDLLCSKQIFNPLAELL